MEIRAIAPNEWKYTYSQSMQLEGQTGNIGHLRGDFGSGGYGFYTTWNDHRPQWKTDEFKTELDEVINALRSEEYGLLKSRTVARRAERAVVALQEGEDMRPAPRQYLNRLSDLLFVLSRVLSRMDGGSEVYWKSERLARQAGDATE